MENERVQTVNAITSIIACRLAANVIREGYVRVCSIQTVPVVITKAELLQNVKRDFRITKKIVPKEKPKWQFMAEVVDPSSLIRDFYVGPYTRNYEGKVFQEVIRSLDYRLWTFDKIRYLDICGQLIKDGGLIELCKQIPKCPIEVLALSKNGITDIGMIEFSKIWRSLAHLSILHISENLFSDQGLYQLLEENNYSPTLEHLNVSMNDVGSLSGYALGLMFSSGRICKLNHISVGGQRKYVSIGDSFIQAFVPHLLYPNAHPLHTLDVAYMGLRNKGILAVATLMAYSNTLVKLNISGNSLATSLYFHHFCFALKINTSLENVMLYQCGFTLKRMRCYEAEVMQRKYARRSQNDNNNNNNNNNNSSSKMTAITSIEDGALNNMLYEDDATIDSLSIESPDENKYSTGVVKHMGWNELKSMAHIFANEKCMLERIRFDEDDNQYKIKNAVVPKPKPTMPTRGKNATLGSGVTGVKKAPDLYFPSDIDVDSIAVLKNTRNPRLVAPKRMPKVWKQWKNPKVVDKYICDLVKKSVEMEFNLSKENAVTEEHHANSGVIVMSPSTNLNVEKENIIDVKKGNIEDKKEEEITDKICESVQAVEVVEVVAGGKGMTEEEHDSLRCSLFSKLEDLMMMLYTNFQDTPQSVICKMLSQNVTKLNYLKTLYQNFTQFTKIVNKEFSSTIAMEKTHLEKGGILNCMNLLVVYPHIEIDYIVDKLVEYKQKVVENEKIQLLQKNTYVKLPLLDCTIVDSTYYLYIELLLMWLNDMLSVYVETRNVLESSFAQLLVKEFRLLDIEESNGFEILSARSKGDDDSTSVASVKSQLCNSKYHNNNQNSIVVSSAMVAPTISPSIYHDPIDYVSNNKLLSEKYSFFDEVTHFNMFQKLLSETTHREKQRILKELEMGKKPTKRIPKTTFTPKLGKRFNMYERFDAKHNTAVDALPVNDATHALHGTGEEENNEVGKGYEAMDAGGANAGHQAVHGGGGEDGHDGDDAKGVVDGREDVGMGGDDVMQDLTTDDENNNAAESDNMNDDEKQKTEKKKQRKKKETSDVSPTGKRRRKRHPPRNLTPVIAPLIVEENPECGHDLLLAGSKVKHSSKSHEKHSLLPIIRGATAPSNEEKMTFEMGDVSGMTSAEITRYRRMKKKALAESNLLQQSIDSQQDEHL